MYYYPTELNTTMKSATTSRKEVKRISFASECDIIPSQSPLDRLEDWRGVWYQASDLDHFRTEARNLCRQMRLLQQTNTSMNDSSSCCLAAVAMTTRGLEQRSCLERQRRKYLVTKCIVRAQRKLDDVRLAALAHKCNAWAVDLATEEAARDFVRAYLEDTTTAATAKRSACGSKRSLPPSDEDTILVWPRRVRPRLIPIITTIDD